jgi:hypothetical protein
VPRGRKKGQRAVSSLYDYQEEHGEFAPLEEESWDYSGCIEWKDTGPYSRGTKTMVVTPKGVEMAKKLRARHCNTAIIAHLLGAKKTTFNDAVKRQPELQEAMESGRGIGEHHIVMGLVRAANAGFAPALMYLGKVLYGHRENDTPQTNVSNVTIQLPASMTLEQMRQLKAEGLTVNQLPMPNFDEIGDELKGEVVYAEGQEASVPDDSKH